MKNIEQIQKEVMRAVAIANTREGHDFRTDYGSPFHCLTGDAANTLFCELAKRWASVTKARYADMKDCHHVSNELKHVLNSFGYHDARVVGCTVLYGKADGVPLARCGEFAICDKPAHSVVLVSGYLVDATTGQFRHQVSMPDYLVIPPDTASEMLKTNRHWVETTDKALIRSAVRTDGLDYSIAYIPTDLDWEWNHVSQSHCA
jgi:hypothetical protein